MDAQPAEQQKLRQSEKKWTPTLIQAGWLIIPSIILERQQGLGLDATDVNILLHLARHWWTSEKLPYPSKRTIAECMGIDPSTVRRHLADMEKRGIIKRVPRSNRKFGQQTNQYGV
jgi:DNA-binding MarR family transcriptional regulator